MRKIWSCNIGEVEESRLPEDGDGPMREAVEKAHLELTGIDCKFNFSGWGAELTETERYVQLVKSDGTPR